MAKRWWLAIVVLGLASVASATEWVWLRDDKHGFAMLMPEGTRTSGRDFGNGWAGGYAKYGVTEFYGIARLGVFSEPEVIEEFAVRVTKIPSQYWTKVDEGRNNPNGWRWYRTWRANNEQTVVWAVMGAGPRGSYCIFLKTTMADYMAGQEAYVRWYTSLSVY